MDNIRKLIADLREAPAKKIKLRLLFDECSLSFVKKKKRLTDLSKLAVRYVEIAPVILNLIPKKGGRETRDLDSFPQNHKCRWGLYGVTCVRTRSFAVARRHCCSVCSTFSNFFWKILQSMNWQQCYFSFLCHQLHPPRWNVAFIVYNKARKWYILWNTRYQRRSAKKTTSRTFQRWQR